MRTEPSLLLPIFRSDGQRRLLARLYLGADDPLTLAGLARELGLDRGNVKREADRLEQAGLVRSERIGRQRILRANRESPYFRDLYGLLVKAFGPETLVAGELARIPGVEDAYLFGSWAARYHGETGPDPADVDVVVVGEPSQIAIARAERKLAETLGREVNVTVVSERAWEAADSGLLREVRRRPLIRLDLGEDERR